MKKIFMVMVMVLLLSLSVVAYPICAEEGSSTGHAYFIADFTSLPFSKDTMRVNYESNGISVSDGEKGLFHNCSNHAAGSLEIVKGVITDSGFMVITLTSGDKVFATYKASGKMGKPTIVKGTYTYVSGTGKAKGITGGGEFTRYSLQPPTKGKAASFNITKSHWKLP